MYIPGREAVRMLPLFCQQSENYSDRNIILDELYQSDDLNLINNGHIKINENTINFASATPKSSLFPVENFKLVFK